MTRPRNSADGGRETRDALQRRRLPVPREELANERGGDRLRETFRRNENDGGQERKQLNTRARVVALFRPWRGPRFVDLSAVLSRSHEMHRVDSLYWTDARLCRGAARPLARARLICPLRRVRISSGR